jgi:hypothetical protein
MKRGVAAVLLIFLACRAREAVTPVAERAATTAAVQDEQASAAAPAAQPVARVIIRNATMSIVVRDAVDVLRRVSTLVENKGGYVAGTRQWKEREQVRANAVLRVPSKELYPTLAALRGLAVRVDSESVNAEDVTQEYTDLGAQLKNIQAAETELRELLRTVRERTQKAADIIEIYNEITKVRGEIERIQGRLQYLSQMAALSTITVDLIPDVLAAPVVEPGWQPVATIKTASRALVNSLKFVADALIWIVLYALPLAILFMVLALIVRAIWRKVRQSAAPKA